MKDEVSGVGYRETNKLRPVFPPVLTAILLFPVLFCLWSCGSSYYYEEAVALERQGLLLKAADAYSLFAGRNPGDKRAPVALFKSAEIYSRKLGLCAKARPVLETLLRGYPDDPSRSAAMKALVVCPDYMPVDRPFHWTYGDSDTGGVNARQVVRMTDWGPDRGSMTARIYAGRKLVSTQKKQYALKGFDLMEVRNGRDALVMKYPAEKGSSWLSKMNGQSTRFTVEAVGLKVKVRAGEFENCVKIKQAMDGAPSWIYEYYAPWTGKVLTSVAGKGFENRVTELVKYEETKK